MAECNEGKKEKARDWEKDSAACRGRGASGKKKGGPSARSDNRRSHTVAKE